MQCFVLPGPDRWKRHERASVWWTNLALLWFTGNIGFHRIHHLSPRIPNHRLQACYDENPLLQKVSRLTLASSLKSIFLVLWEEKQRRLVTFRQARL